MHATLQMLRNVARRGRKRWLSLALSASNRAICRRRSSKSCNTRIVHTLRSMHNLEVLTTTAGDVGREMWARCPLLGPGEAIVTSPQLKRARHCQHPPGHEPAQVRPVILWNSIGRARLRSKPGVIVITSSSSFSRA